MGVMDPGYFNTIEGWCFLSAILSFLCLLPESVVFYHHYKRNGLQRKRVVGSMLCLMGFTVLRGVWMLLRSQYTHAHGLFWTNRTAQLLFFSGFTLYLESWAIVVSKAERVSLVPDNGDMEARLDRWTFLVNVVVWAAIDILALFRSRTLLWKVLGSMLLSLVVLIMTLGVVIFGRGMRRTMSLVELEAVVRLRSNIGCAMSVCIVCFTVRAFFWLYHPIFHEFSPHGTYPWCYYTLVELPPLLTLFNTLASPMRQEHQPQDATEHTQTFWRSIISRISRDVTAASMRVSRATMSGFRPTDVGGCQIDAGVVVASDMRDFTNPRGTSVASLTNPMMDPGRTISAVSTIQESDFKRSGLSTIKSSMSTISSFYELGSSHYSSQRSSKDSMIDEFGEL